MTTALTVVDLGRQPYRPVLELQREVVRARLDGRLGEDVLILVEHEPVVTLGRGTRASSLPLSVDALRTRGFEVEEVERGGDVTVHAPGQLVGYPILDLHHHRLDLHWYLRRIEEGLMAALAELGIEAGRNPGFTGVWTGPRKIASIGVHVKQWVTLHGFALNITTDLRHFEAVVPCGIEGVVMTSVARELGPAAPAPKPLWAATGQAVRQAFGRVFDRAPVEEPPDRLTAVTGLGNPGSAAGVIRP